MFAILPQSPSLLAGEGDVGFVLETCEEEEGEDEEELETVEENEEDVTESEGEEDEDKKNEEEEEITVVADETGKAEELETVEEIEGDVTDSEGEEGEDEENEEEEEITVVADETGKAEELETVEENKGDVMESERKDGEDEESEEEEEITVVADETGEAEEPETVEENKGDVMELEGEDGEDEENEEEEMTVVADEAGKAEELEEPEERDSDSSDVTKEVSAEEVAAQLYRPPAWAANIMSSIGKETFTYLGEDIVIHESIDSYGGIMWPGALALCSFLENNRRELNLQGKRVLELGAGTGLVTIVASLLGAAVTTTDLPNVLSNLRANVMRNTRGRCSYLPRVEALCWDFNPEPDFPQDFDYVMAADVVYHHDFLPQLLATMMHFCQQGATVLWANKLRMVNDRTFTKDFQEAFDTRLLFEDGDMKIFMGTCKE